MIIAATGHRPGKLGGHDPKHRFALGGLAVDVLYRYRPAEVIVGMALGWDQAVCGAALALQIPVHAAIPFEGQEQRWPSEARDRYRRLLDKCDSVTVISKWPGDQAYRDRNCWMVDRANGVFALWNGSLGGTHHCVRYAERQGKPVTNFWDTWTLNETHREALAGL